MYVGMNIPSRYLLTYLYICVHKAQLGTYLGSSDISM